MSWRTVDQLDVEGRRVLCRLDLNVPLDGGQITDDLRIRAALPTVRSIVERGGVAVCMSHLGRPKGVDDALRLAPVGARLGELLERPVTALQETVGDAVRSALEGQAPGSVVLLENLRFDKGEKANDPAFVEQLAACGELYVNDAFGTAHRAHASTAGMVEHVPVAAAGLLLAKELDALAAALEPARPFVCFLGGAKVSDKIGVLEALIERADAIGVGGAMAYTFLRAQGLATGASLVEEDRLDDARRMIARAAERGCELMLPSDHVVSDRLEDGAPADVVETIPDGRMGVDIGPATTAPSSRIPAVSSLGASQP